LPANVVERLVMKVGEEPRVEFRKD
jgi:hypothetical protein